MLSLLFYSLSRSLPFLPLFFIVLYYIESVYFTFTASFAVRCFVCVAFFSYAPQITLCALSLFHCVCNCVTDYFCGLLKFFCSFTRSINNASKTTC